MQKSLLSSMVQTAGFAVIAFFFFIWYMGYQKNTAPIEISASEPAISRAEIGRSFSSEEKDTRYYDAYEKKNSYNDRNRIKAPEPVATTSDAYQNRYNVDQASVFPSGSHSKTNTTIQKPESVRSWKGVHRDESFAWLCFDRFGQEVAILSEKHGLYPDVFLSRIIAYSYEFTSDPRNSPNDNNFPGLAQPQNHTRARFRSPEESLKAYAVLHAGEVTRLSREGAIARNDRAWTMRKIIDSYAFISDLAKDQAGQNAYNGRIGKANKISNEESYQHEVVGETMKMVSTVNDIVKKHQAEKKGYNSWEDYLDDLTDEERLQQEEEAAAKTSAISKKKAFNVGRRVDAKLRKQED